MQGHNELRFLYKHSADVSNTMQVGVKFSARCPRNRFILCILKYVANKMSHYVEELQLSMFLLLVILPIIFLCSSFSSLCNF